MWTRRFGAIVRQSSRHDPVAHDVRMDQWANRTCRPEPVNVLEIADPHQSSTPFTPCALHDHERGWHTGLAADLNFRRGSLSVVSGDRSHISS